MFTGRSGDNRKEGDPEHRELLLKEEEEALPVRTEEPSGCRERPEESRGRILKPRCAGVGL